MAFDVRTKGVTKQLQDVHYPNGLYIATYEAFDNEDADFGTKSFQIQGETKLEITQKLTAKIIKLKAIYEQQSSWIELSDSVIQDLRDEGIL